MALKKCLRKIRVMEINVSNVGAVVRKDIRSVIAEISFLPTGRIYTTECLPLGSRSYLKISKEPVQR